MKKLLLVILLLTVVYANKTKACYATFTHTNGCTGDTVWFYGLDLTSLHAWDFGDSTYGLANLSFNDTAFHVYTKPGTYYVEHFVNVGAEWAFQMDAITISANCFAADFTANCQGSLSYSFANQSVGKNLSYTWNFGEPSSGTSDTSSSGNPAHTYASAGNYAVTLIISDGTHKDTAAQTIKVENTCMSVATSYLLNPCYMDTAYFYYTFSGVTSVYWNFGDTASGNNNYSTDFTPRHIFSSPGLFVGSLTYTNGTDTATIPVINNVVDCNVWPGDANRDGEVSGEDLFPIALYYGDTGVKRNNASPQFVPQSCSNWGNQKMYLQDLVDMKQADCNADGVIDSLDVKAVLQNFGKKHNHHNNESQMQLVPADAPVMSLALSKHGYDAEFNRGGYDRGGYATVSLSQVVGVYGFCVNVKYDNIFVDAKSITVDFTNTWLDTAGHPNLLTFFYNDVENGILTIVEARTNHYSKSDSGALAIINFNFRDTSLDGSTSPIDLEILPDSKLLSNSLYPSGMPNENVQNYLRFNIENDSAEVVWEGVPTIQADNIISLYPSPASELVNINSGISLNEASVKLFDAVGRLVLVSTMNGRNLQLPVNNLSDGIYLLEISSESAVYKTKFAVARNQ